MERKGKVYVKPVYRHREYYKEGHDGQFMFTGCVSRVYLPYDSKTKRLKQVLTKEEQTQLEEELALKPGALNVNRREDNFWHEHRVDLDKSGIILNLEDPLGFIDYKILDAQAFVASSWKERLNSPEYQYALVIDNEDELEEAKTAETNAKAYMLLAKISKSKVKMRNALRLMNREVPENISPQAMLSQIDKVIQTKKGTRGVLTINDFIAAMEDPLGDIKILVKDAIEIGEVVKRGSEFRLRSGDLIGLTFMQAVDFFRDKGNQEYRLTIEQRIKKGE